MTPIPAKVLNVDGAGDQYFVSVRIGHGKYSGTFEGLQFGEKKPYFGSYRCGWLELVYHQNPKLKLGQPFPLWAAR